MSRPAVSVVMPFAGTADEAEAALNVLRALAVRADDELILADNSGTAPTDERVTVVAATGELSPSRARNAGAERADREWILFLDADCRAPADLLDRFFTRAVAEDVGALAGAVVPAASPRASTGLAARYGAAKSFLDQDAHLAHGYLPRAVAANLLVRRRAFEGIGGFYEGVRAAEDTDFSWRLQRAGWRLEGRRSAMVEHRYRATVGALRRQWRGYAAGRAWLGRRYAGFAPEPALRRAGRRVLHRRPAPGARLGSSAPDLAPAPAPAPAPVPAPDP
ncbi:MAG: glycosyltransferase family 2 protein, partial [Solirubrobacteraceae bacterium]